MKHVILESSKHTLKCEVPTTIILCQLTPAGPDVDQMEFCTWIQCWDEETGLTRCGCVTGHYFDNLNEALEDYHERATNHHNAAMRQS